MVLSSLAALGGGAAAGAGAGAATGAALTGMAALKAALGSIAGAALKSAGIGAAINAGTTAIGGGTVGDILKGAGKGAATGAVAGAAGSDLAAATNIAKGAQAGSLLAKVSTATSKIGNTINKVQTNIGDKVGALGKNTNNLANPNTIEPVAIKGGTSFKMYGKVPVEQTPGGIKMSASLPKPDIAASLKAKNAPVAKSVEYNTSARALQVKNTPIPKHNGKAGNLGNKISGQALGQVGLQGILSIASGIGAYKTSQDANKISQQGLLFQKKTYEESKALEEKTKKQIKADALNSYNSGLLFGEQLQNNSISNNLLTNTQTGNTGNFSLLSSGITTRHTDLT